MPKTITSYFDKVLNPDRAKRSRSSPEITGSAKKILRDMERTPPGRASKPLGSCDCLPVEVQRESEMLRSSPGPPKSVAAVDKVSLDIIRSSLSELLDSKGYATKMDIAAFDTKLDAIVTENRALKEEVEKLHSKNKALEMRLDSLENAIKKNNLIFKNLGGAKEREPFQIVATFCEEVLGFDKASLSLTSAKFIGAKEAEKRMISATFTNAEDVWKILKSTHKLKNSPFTIDRDYSWTTRKVRSKLLQVRKEIRKANTKLSCRVNGERMTVDNSVFYWDPEKGLRHKKEDGTAQLNKLVGKDMSDFLKQLLSHSRPQQQGNKALE